jgi:two-component system OmpR family sensor kinase/two-component system sensor histidine kinase BaeS
MNRLWVRLTLAFCAVTVVGVLVVAVLTDWNVDTQFRHYMSRRGNVEQSEPMAGRGPMAGHVQGMIVQMQAADEAFLSQLRGALIIAALAAGGIGTVLGFIISRTIAAPLGHLAKAARDFAAHRWERRAPVQGTSEIAEVAVAFNAMADELQRAETLRRNLMADIAHELRTPLTVMQGSLRALLDGVYPLELREIASIYDETRLLSRLVADLRELALAESGQLALNVQPVEVAPVLRTVADRFTAAAETQQTRIALMNGNTLPRVEADPDRLTQVLDNLLTNALRHTAGGTITVSSESMDEHVRISVQDTGEGIASEDLSHVFDRFYRADDSRSRSTGGVGLGLAIAKSWVEAMGGAIGVTSQPGQGSTFWFTLRKSEPSNASSIEALA